MQKGCEFWYWEEDYIDLLIRRKLLDLGPLVSTDESTNDAISKIEVQSKHPEMTKLVSSDCKAKEEILVGLVGLLKEVVFLMKCLIFVIFMFGSIVLVKNWWIREVANQIYFVAKYQISDQIVRSSITNIFKIVNTNDSLVEENTVHK